MMLFFEKFNVRFYYTVWTGHLQSKKNLPQSILQKALVPLTLVCYSVILNEIVIEARGR